MLIEQSMLLTATPCGLIKVPCDLVDPCRFAKFVDSALVEAARRRFPLVYLQVAHPQVALVDSAAWSLKHIDVSHNAIEIASTTGASYIRVREGNRRDLLEHSGALVKDALLRGLLDCERRLFSAADISDWLFLEAARLFSTSGIWFFVAEVSGAFAGHTFAEHGTPSSEQNSVVLIDTSTAHEYSGTGVATALNAYVARRALESQHTTIRGTISGPTEAIASHMTRLCSCGWRFDGALFCHSGHSV